LVTGLPALPSFVMNNLPSLSFDNHTHPEPNSVTPPFTNSFWNSSKEPHWFSIALANSPLGLPPPFGEN